jgi:hypothetical protein
VTERDPFGRLPGENTLAGLGVPSGDLEFESAEPVPAAAEPVAEAARPAAAREERAAPSRSELAKRRSSESRRSAQQVQAADPQVIKRVARVMKLVFFLFVLVTIGSVGLVVFSAGTSVKDRIAELPSPTQALEDVGKSLDEALEGAGRPPAAEPRGISGRSLLARRNLRPALRRLATSGLGRLKALSIRPERIDAQLLTKGGRLRSVQLTSNGELRKLSLSGAGFAQVSTIAFSRLDPAAPSRLARSAAGRSKKPVSQVGYVVPLVLGSEVSWSVFMRDGRGFVGDARGRIIRRIG